jgi:DNA invertase Pin-like site-specific DNA recombinase
MIYGYARVSTTGQDISIQKTALTAASCQEIRSEKVSGASREGRRELDALLTFTSKGDTIVVARVDRLARSIGDLQDIVRTLKSKGVALKATEQPIDSSTAAGKAFLDMLGVFAEFETDLREERQLEGIAKAKTLTGDAKVYKGGKRRLDREAVKAMRDARQGVAAIAKALDCSRMQVYRVLAQQA